MKLCECGCGKQAPIATKTARRQGYTKGLPMRFIRGHQFLGRLPHNHIGRTVARCGHDGGPYSAKRPDCRACAIAAEKRRVHGITPSRYATLLDEQGGVCAICGQGETELGHAGRVKALSVDHDHETGAVRGLLCVKCNAGIGMFGESLERLAAAIKYLEDRSGRKEEAVVWRKTG